MSLGMFCSVMPQTITFGRLSSFLLLEDDIFEEEVNF